MAIFLHGLGLQYYRGIGPDRQRIGPFGEFNFFIGLNNSGKSTILDFISSQPPFSGQVSTASAKEYRGAKTGKTFSEIGIPRETVEEYWDEKFKGVNRHQRELLATIGRALATDGLIWVYKSGDPTRSVVRLSPENIIHEELLSSSDWQNLWTAVTRFSGGGSPDQWRENIIEALFSGISLNLPKTFLIPTVRFIGDKGDEFKDQSGRGLIDRLAELQSPDHTHREDYEVFDTINQFVRYVTDKPDAKNRGSTSPRSPSRPHGR